MREPSLPLALGAFGLSLLPLIIAVGTLVVGGRQVQNARVAPLIAGSSEAEDLAHRRRRDAKQFNERLKSRVNFLNGIGVALFVAVAVTLPGQAQTPRLSIVSGLLGLLTAGVAHMLSLRVLGRWKSED